jgi:integrase
MARREYPGVYPYPTAGGRTLYWTLYTRQQRAPASEAWVHQPERGGQVPPADAGPCRARRAAGHARDVRRAFDGWLKSHHRASKGTRDGYRAASERRLKPFFGRLRLSAIDVQTVRSFVAEMVELVEGGELAPKTVNNTLSCLSSCLKDAVAIHKIASNPCEHIGHLPERHIEGDWLRRGKVPRYLAACSEIYRTLAELLIATDVRISEALALRWDDIDFDRHVIRVYRQRTASGDDHTKSRRFRSVSVGDRLVRILRDDYARQSELYAFDLSRGHVFVMPIRMHRHDRGRWQSRTPGKPMDRTRDLTRLAQAGARGRRPARHAAARTPAHGCSLMDGCWPGSR